MVVRSALAQATQIGVETTPGVAVAAGKRLRSLGFAFTPMISDNMFRPQGIKYPTVSAPGEEWTEFAVSGQPTFDEIIYALSSVGTAAVVTTPDSTNAPSARQWAFSPSSTNADAPKSYTVEQGGSVRSHRSAGVQLTALSLSGNAGRGALSLGGSALGRAIEDGITLTANPTSFPDIPIKPTQVSWFLDTTAGGIGTTKLGRTVLWSWNIGDRFGRASFYDAAQPSYTELVETEPSANVSITPEANAEGMASLPLMRSGDTRFLRIEAVGPVIGGTIAYRLRLDQAVKVRTPGAYSDQDGIFTLPFTFQIVDDAAFGGAWKAEVRNVQAAL